MGKHRHRAPRQHQQPSTAAPADKAPASASDDDVEARAVSDQQQCADSPSQPAAAIAPSEGSSVTAAANPLIDPVHEQLQLAGRSSNPSSDKKDIAQAPAVPPPVAAKPGNQPSDPPPPYPHTDDSAVQDKTSPGAANVPTPLKSPSDKGATRRTPPLVAPKPAQKPGSLYVPQCMCIPFTI